VQDDGLGNTLGAFMSAVLLDTWDN
jgi:hypothetical protein